MNLHTPEIDMTIPLIMLGAAVLGTSLLQKLKVSPILGYLLAGLLIGPSALALIQSNSATHLLAELGIVFLLFAIGLELPFERLRVMRHWVFGFGGFTTVGLMILFTSLVYIVYPDFTQAVIIGCALGFSSTALLVQLLAERGEFSTRYGRASFSAALFQDLMVVPLLVAVPLLTENSDTLLYSVTAASAKAIVALILIMLAGRWLLRPFYRLVVGNKNHELFTAMNLLVVLGLSVATYQFGLSMALGAFLAGVILAETELRHQVAADIEPFRGLFLGMFFMTIGMMIDLHLLMSHFGLLIGLLVGMIAIKFTTFYLGARIYGLPWHKACKTGILLAQGGEFAFVLMGIGLTQNMISADMHNLFSMVVICSMIVTPIAMRLTWPRLSDKQDASSEDMISDDDFTDKRDHVVIAGFGRVGEIIAEMCASHNIPHIIVDEDHDRVTRARANDWPVFYGDASKSHVLRSVGVAYARAVVVAVSGSKQATQIVHIMRENWPKIPVFGRARDGEHAKKLLAAGATATVPITLNASLELGKVMLHALGLDQGQIQNAADSVRQNHQNF